MEKTIKQPEKNMESCIDYTRSVKQNRADSAGKPAGQYANQFLDSSQAASDKHLKGAALKAYKKQTRQQEENKLIVEFLPLVYKIVQQIVNYLQPPLTREDLISAGTIGLVKAARDFDPSHEAEFKTYAYIRIRGAVIDELRSWSFTPSNLRKQFEEAQKIMQQMIDKNGKMPSDETLAEKLGMPVDKMYRMFENARARHFLSIHGVSEESPALGEQLKARVNQPEDRIEKTELINKLTEAITKLPDKQRQIIVMYYTKECTMKEIAEVLEVTESRVSQLHASALFKLSTKLKLWDDTRQ